MQRHSEGRPGPERRDRVATLLRQLYQRDSWHAATWQIDEAVETQLRSFDSWNDELKDHFLTSLEREYKQDHAAIFADNLQDWLTRKGWNQSDLARAIGANPSVVSKWVRGKQRPQPDQCARIAEVTRKSADYVLELAGHRPREMTGFRVANQLGMSNVRVEVGGMLNYVPEPMLAVLAPMIRGLIESVSDEKTINALDKTLSGIREWLPPKGTTQFELNMEESE
jgi:plasmid maintenance system antidote protein VapI